jgi:FKBP-type peptidyl-prolyl cis-trans isomerase FkpA
MSVTAVPIRPIRRGSVLKLWLALGVLGLGAAAIAYIGTEAQVAADPATFLTRNSETEGVVTTLSGLQFQTVTPGSGPRIGINDGAIIDYTGRLIDGTVFDTTEGKGPAPLLVRQVVPGFSEALQLMQPGGKYRIWIPPELGYGTEVPPDGPIPPNAVLEFDVAILQVVPDAALQMQNPGAGAPPQGAPPGAAQGGM